MTPRVGMRHVESSADRFLAKRLAPRKPLDLADDPHRALYLLEKAKRQERANPRLDAARREFDAHLEREKQARRGGRPKSPHFGRKNAKPIELADGLEAFGESA